MLCWSTCIGAAARTHPLGSSAMFSFDQAAGSFFPPESESIRVYYVLFSCYRVTFARSALATTGKTESWMHQATPSQLGSVRTALNVPALTLQLGSMIPAPTIGLMPWQSAPMQAAVTALLENASASLGTQVSTSSAHHVVVGYFLSARLLWIFCTARKLACFFAAQSQFESLFVLLHFDQLLFCRPGMRPDFVPEQL